MTLGPLEILEIGFAENQFNGRIVPEIQKLIDREIINVVDGVLVIKDIDGDVTIVEFEQTDIEPALAEFGALLGEAFYDLVTTEDAEEFAKALDPGSSAAILVVEHAWAKPFRDAVLESGGELLMNFRIPGAVVEEVLAAADLDQ